MIFRKKDPAPAEEPVVPPQHPPHAAHPLDELTGGAFSAPTSGERAARIREWMTGEPPVEQMQEVFRELSHRDKGASRQLRERLEEIKRQKAQEAIIAEWAARAQELLDAPRLNIADALAWQRDAARAGAPLSREPLAGLKNSLGERVKRIEDLQIRVQVQREAAILLAQRIEILSTKPWSDARDARGQLHSDVQAWQQQAADITADECWSSVDGKFPTQLESAATQLQTVWNVFADVVEQAIAAAADATAALPPVPLWADEIRALHGIKTEPVKEEKPAVDPAVRDKAIDEVRQALAVLEKETTEGHGKASAGAAAALRAVLKTGGQYIDSTLEHQVNSALVAAGELQGWQRWSADQVREELIGKIEGLLKLPEAQRPGGRKMQETLRHLREQWKQADHGGAPNHALWKRFDDACNEAHKTVEAWLEKVRTEAAEHRALREQIIAQVNEWAQANAGADNWKEQIRALRTFAQQWRDAGHVSEKVYAELRPLWKQASASASQALEAVQKQSMELRQAMIEEARALGAQAALRIDAVKELQQRWQAEAQRVPMERRQEQKLWDAFRKPIDEAFQRKTQEREKAHAALHAHDRAVLEAARALDEASAGQDAQKIRSAMAALEAALQGQPEAESPPEPQPQPEAAEPETATADEPPAQDNAAEAREASTEQPQDEALAQEEESSADAPAEETAPEPAKTAPPVKKVVAVRGDDRPGARRDAALATTTRQGARDQGGRDRRDARKGPRDAAPGRRDDARAGRFDSARPPRLGDAAFRAQRQALDNARMALKKLTSQAHGETLTQLVGAWEQRDAGKVPAASELGSRVSQSVRGQWAQAIAAAPAGDAATALLRLEIASGAHTPPEHMDARRALQLQMLTRRNDPPPEQTWTQDAATVLAAPWSDDGARRLQAALRTLMRKS